MEKELYKVYPQYYTFKYRIVDSEETYKKVVSLLDHSESPSWQMGINKRLGNIEAILAGKDKCEVERSYKVGRIKITPSRPYVRIIKNKKAAVVINRDAFLAPAVNMENYEDKELPVYYLETRPVKREEEARYLVEQSIESLKALGIK